MPRPEIWVVEDNDHNFELLEFLLADAGYEVTRARDGVEFTRLLRGPAPALILLDMSLPATTGLDLVREVRGLERFRAVPVVAVTAHAMRGDRERFLEAGCDGYVSKPIEAESFLAEVARHAGRGGVP